MFGRVLFFCWICFSKLNLKLWKFALIVCAIINTKLAHLSGSSYPTKADSSLRVEVIYAEILRQQIHKTFANFAHKRIKGLLCDSLFGLIFHKYSYTVVKTLLWSEFICLSFGKLTKLTWVCAIKETYFVQGVLFWIALVKLVLEHNQIRRT